MIRYQLTCANGDAFEAWFRNSGDFDLQAERGQIGCPLCGDAQITKAPMAPAIVKSRSKAGEEGDTPRVQAMTMAHKLRDHVRDHFDYVGERFPEEARAIHDGEAQDRPIWGEATQEQAQAMADEGLPVAPLPAEIAPMPPRKLN